MMYHGPKVIRDLIEAAIKAQEWAANFPLQGTASDADNKAATDVYLALNDALKQWAKQSMDEP